MSTVIKLATPAARGVRQIQMAAAALTFWADEPGPERAATRHRLIVGYRDDAVGNQEAYFLAEAMATPQDFEAIDALVSIDEVL